MEIPLPDTDEPLYVAGYRNGYEIEGVLDFQRANAVWLDTGNDGILLIGVDCVGLSRDTVLTIREQLSDFCKETGCRSVNVYATHTHAGVDTLGLWGKVAQNGKNKAFMANVISAAVESAKLAYKSTEVNIPLDNTIFMYYRFLGILGNPVSQENAGETGYSLESEVGLLMLGDIAVFLIPGETFPELVLSDGGYTGEVTPLENIAEQYGIENHLIAGLCNDELGYIVTPEDFYLHETQPYLTNGTDAEGRRHYEETNSTGKYTAKYIAEAFERLLNGK